MTKENRSEPTDHIQFEELYVVRTWVGKQNKIASLVDSSSDRAVGTWNLCPFRPPLWSGGQMATEQMYCASCEVRTEVIHVM
jgi:hypothetical protein